MVFWLTCNWLMGLSGFVHALKLQVVRPNADTIANIRNKIMRCDEVVKKKRRMVECPEELISV